MVKVLYNIGERKRHNMIKKLLVIPLLLGVVSCTDNIKRDNKIYENVAYYFNHDKLCYVVKLDEKDYSVEPSKYYLIKIDYYEYTKDKKDLLFNEFYMSTKELFVYERR